MSKRQLVLDAINNKPVERVPVGFWFHFSKEEASENALEDQTAFLRNVDGHNKFFHDFHPDFVKLMSDGFFRYPSSILHNVTEPADLLDMKPLGPDHPWINKQVELVKTLTDSFGSEVFTFYNIFAPATLFRFAFGENRNKVLADYILEDKSAVKYALDVIAEDLATLAERVITEGKADGIYLSVQNVQDSRISLEQYKEVIAPGELHVLSAANRVSDNNILHICGYEGSRNNLDFYVSYQAKIINWAVNIENVSLEDGKKLFGGRAVIGGFDNRRTGVLYSGSKEEVEAHTEKLILKSGKTGILLGADCTVPYDINLERLEWVRAKASTL